MDQLTDDQILEFLRNMLTRIRAQYADDLAKVGEVFRKDRQKVYPNHHHLIEQVIAEQGGDNVSDAPARTSLLVFSSYQEPLYFPPTDEEDKIVENQKVVVEEPTVVSPYQDPLYFPPTAARKTRVARKVRKSTDKKTVMKGMCYNYLLYGKPKSFSARELHSAINPEMTQKSFANYLKELYDEGKIDRTKSEYFRIGPGKTSWTWLYFAK